MKGLRVFELVLRVHAQGAHWVKDKGRQYSFFCLKRFLALFIIVCYRFTSKSMCGFFFWKPGTSFKSKIIAWGKKLWILYIGMLEEYLQISYCIFIFIYLVLESQVEAADSSPQTLFSKDVFANFPLNFSGLPFPRKHWQFFIMFECHPTRCQKGLIPRAPGDEPWAGSDGGCPAGRFSSVKICLSAWDFFHQKNPNMYFFYEVVFRYYLISASAYMFCSFFILFYCVTRCNKKSQPFCNIRFKIIKFLYFKIVNHFACLHAFRHSQCICRLSYFLECTWTTIIQNSKKSLKN